MFSTVNHFQKFKSGSVTGRHGMLQIQQENQPKASEQHQTLKRPGLEMAKEVIVHVKNMQRNKMNNIFPHTA